MICPCLGHLELWLRCGDDARRPGEEEGGEEAWEEEGMEGWEVVEWKEATGALSACSLIQWLGCANLFLHIIPIVFDYGNKSI